GQPLEERKVHMYVEPLGLEASKAVGDRREYLAHSGEVIEGFLQMKVREVVATHFASEKSKKLLVLFDKGVLKIGSQDVMTVLDSLQGDPQLALKMLGDALTKELGDFVGRQEQNSQLAGALEELSDGKVTLKDEVAAVLNLTDGVKAIEVHGQSFPLGEFRSKQVCPVVEPLADPL